MAARWRSVALSGAVLATIATAVPHLASPPTAAAASVATGLPPQGVVDQRDALRALVEREVPDAPMASPASQSSTLTQSAVGECRDAREHGVDPDSSFGIDIATWALLGQCGGWSISLNFHRPMTADLDVVVWALDVDAEPTGCLGDDYVVLAETYQPGTVATQMLRTHLVRTPTCDSATWRLEMADVMTPQLGAGADRLTLSYPAQHLKLPTTITWYLVVYASDAPDGEWIPGPRRFSSPTVDSWLNPFLPAQQPSAFVPLAPRRLLDTREGLGAAPGRRARNSSFSFPVAGRGGVPPAGATAVVLNLTATEPVGSGWYQIAPTGTPAGSSSNLNVDGAGSTRANLAVVPLGPDGQLTVHAQAGGHVIADVFGYFTPAPVPRADGRFLAAPARRLLDTRGTAAAHATPRTMAIAGTSGVPLDAAAVAVTVTVTESARSGYVQVVPSGGPTALGASSNLNVDRPGQTVSNLVLVPLGGDGAITFFDTSGSQLVVDLVGSMTGSSAAVSGEGRFVPAVPTRVMDTRGAPVAPPRLTDTVVDSPASARSGPWLANVTVAGARAAGYVQARRPSDRPGATSNLNLAGAGSIVANQLVLPGEYESLLFTHAGGHLVVDIVGSFTQA